MPNLAAPAREVAPQLLGMELVHHSGGVERSGLIVEVEAYEGADDPASHAHNGRTERNAVMFGPAGRAYVYRSYGIHWCMNVVCGSEGVASAVLIRALQPLIGIDVMWRDRPKAKKLTDLASGPGKLCAALGLGHEHYGSDLFDPDSSVQLRQRSVPSPDTPTDGVRVGLIDSGLARPRPARAGLTGAGLAGSGLVVQGPRVGISRAVERPWRFAIGGNPHVSRPRPPGWAEGGPTA